MGGDALPGFSSASASTEAPLEMLAACHQRILAQCRTLQRLAAHLPQHGVDADAQSAARAVMRYFDTAAPQHHEDEEQDLFPALAEAMAGSDAVCIRELSGSLQQQHLELAAHWRRMRALLAPIAQGAASASLTPEQVQAFECAYAEHIAREEAELLPMAARLLSDDALAHIGAAMRARRGIAAV